MGAQRHTRVKDAATFSDDDLRSLPPALPFVPDDDDTPAAAAAFVVVALAPVAGCFQIRSSSSTARWYHGDFFDRPLAFAVPPSFDLHQQQHLCHPRHVRNSQLHQRVIEASTEMQVKEYLASVACGVFLAMFCSKREWRNISGLARAVVRRQQGSSVKGD